jgi:hypothetical protein
LTIRPEHAQHVDVYVHEYYRDWTKSL